MEMFSPDLTLRLCLYFCKTCFLISLPPPPSLYTPAHSLAKQAQPIKRPIQIGPKVSIQPKPLITALPLTHAAAPLQAKTIIIQPLQTTVLPAVKPAPVSIQPAPPPGQSSHIETRCLTSHCIASDQCAGYISKQCVVLYFVIPFCNLEMT